MSEAGVIDFETFMKTTNVAKFDPKKYVQEQRALAMKQAQEEAKQKEIQKKDEDVVSTDLDTQTKNVVKNAEMQIEYTDFAIPTKIEVKKSSIHGNGIFAKETIADGEVIEELRLFRLAWRMAYQKDPVLERYAIVDNSCKCRDCSIHGPSVYIPMGYGALYNYGFDSNIRAQFDFPNLKMKIIATEEIAAGKEILFDDSAFSGKMTLSESLK